MPKMEADKKVVQESLRCILNGLEARMSLMMCEGKVGAKDGQEDGHCGLVKEISNCGAT
jgi:hypothetical protein